MQRNAGLIKIRVGTIRDFIQWVEPLISPILTRFLHFKNILPEFSPSIFSQMLLFLLPLKGKEEEGETFHAERYEGHLDIDSTPPAGCSRSAGGVP